MAIFTALSLDDASALLAEYDLGTATRLEGIASGIENTNYFLDTEHGRYVLTVFERLSFDELPFYLQLMRHLALRGLPVPQPAASRSGVLATRIKGKPAAIVSRRPGRAVVETRAAQCAAVGEFLGRMHLQARDFPLFQRHLRGVDWWRSVLPRLAPHLPAPLRTELEAEIGYQEAFVGSAGYARLPAGPIHADLFRDNVLFDTEPADEAAGGRARIGGVIDFYFAGCSLWLFDLAVTVNDWCVDLASGAFDPARTRALLEAYHAVRPLTGDEAQAWPTVLRGAALRFWVSRLYDLHLPRPAQMLSPHDPGRFERMLRLRIAQTNPPWVGP